MIPEKERALNCIALKDRKLSHSDEVVSGIVGIERKKLTMTIKIEVRDSRQMVPPMNDMKRTTGERERN